MSKVAIVTGANQGLGLALVEALCPRLGPEAYVYLTARNIDRGRAAIAQLEKKGLSPSFHQLDVTDEKSLADFARFIEDRHGGVDVFISNAAARISRDIPQAQQVAEFINTNNHGSYRAIEAFAPLLRDNARFLVVASSFGSLSNLAATLHHKFDIDALSLEDIEQTMDDYVKLVESGEDRSHGWPEWINIPSKIGQVASMKVLAKTMQARAAERGILINGVCPGLVDTDASRPWFDNMAAAQSPADAAVDVVWLATLPAGAKTPYGELVQHRKIIPWK